LWSGKPHKTKRNTEKDRKNAAGPAAFFAYKAESMKCGSPGEDSFFGGAGFSAAKEFALSQ
jgi:hypothetical protein